MLVLPMPDYSQRYALWKGLITSKGGQILKWSDKFDLSSLTKISDGYTAGHIKYSVDQTLTDRRVIQQKIRHLQAVEFVGHLAKCEPVHKHEDEAFMQWYLKTPTGKKRNKFLDGEDEDTGKKEKKKTLRRKNRSH